MKPKQLLERGRPVSKDRLGDQIWGEQLPRRVAATIENYISVLRRRLGPALIMTEPGGYRVPAGRGPIDLVFSPSHVTNLGAAWDDPTYAAFLRQLASMSRLILFDKRGTGLSDPALDFPTQEPAALL